MLGHEGSMPLVGSQANNQNSGREGKVIFNNLNLAAVRSRIDELKSSIERLLSIVHELSRGGQQTPWGEVVAQFTVLNSQISFLVGDVSTRYENDDMMDTLKYFAAHPNAVDGPETARALPILLSTKLEVEMEQVQARILEEYEQGVTGKNESQKYLLAQKSIDEFNEMCRAAAEQVQLDRGQRGSRVSQRVPSSHTAGTSASSDALKQARVTPNMTSGLMGAVFAGDGLRSSEGK
mmetsp:Transcript_9757/g.35751  ORF Transcript_9757/g.35751 Transcript_9757/m.35751 type:complete len:236 (+) Transcript_9757:147-854(+)